MYVCIYIYIYIYIYVVHTYTYIVGSLGDCRPSPSSPQIEHPSS